MTAHLTERQIESYKRLSSSQELIAMDEHVAVCAECRERLGLAWDTRAALEGAEERARTRSAEFSIEHLTYEQMESYVDGKMREAAKTLAQAHAERCQECAQQLRDLEAFKLEREHALSKEKEPAKKPASISFFSWAAFARSAAVLVVALGIGLALRWGIGRKPPTRVQGPAPTPTQPAQPVPINSLSEEIAELEPDEQRAVREAIERETIPLPRLLRELPGGYHTLLEESPENPEFRVLEPVGEVVFDSLPLFRWQSLPAATNYTVTIFDAERNLIQKSPALHVSEWKALHSLKQNRFYEWQVTATRKDGTVVMAPGASNPEAAFFVLDEARASALARFSRAHPDAHLVLGILYAQSGALTPSEHELQQLPPSDPNYAVARKLSKRIAEIRRRPERFNLQIQNADRK